MSNMDVDTSGTINGFRKRTKNRAPLMLTKKYQKAMKGCTGQPIGLVELV